MARRKDFRSAITYTGQKIKGYCELSYKIDGVRVLYRDGEFVTRNDKVPPGLDQALSMEAYDKLKANKDCEIYLGSFHKSTGPLARHDPEKGCIKAEHIYPLDHGVASQFDPRLFVGSYEDISPELVANWLSIAVEMGYEGLVIRTDKRWYRVKPSHTADVIITGWFEQEDKHGYPKGQLGGFTTNYGKVTAFTDNLRKSLWDNPEQYVGKMMEVIYKELYDTGKFRYCVTFSRFRDDKDNESFDTKNI
jgi:hypothetical protein